MASISISQRRSQISKEENKIKTKQNKNLKIFIRRTKSVLKKMGGGRGKELKQHMEKLILKFKLVKLADFKEKAKNPLSV